MADSEPVQDQPVRKSKNNIYKIERAQNHSDEVNGESTPDSVIQPKQTIGE